MKASSRAFTWQQHAPVVEEKRKEGQDCHWWSVTSMPVMITTMMVMMMVMVVMMVVVTKV